MTSLCRRGDLRRDAPAGASDDALYRSRCMDELVVAADAAHDVEEIMHTPPPVLVEKAGRVPGAARGAGPTCGLYWKASRRADEGHGRSPRWEMRRQCRSSMRARRCVTDSAVVFLKPGRKRSAAVSAGRRGRSRRPGRTIRAGSGACLDGREDGVVRWGTRLEKGTRGDQLGHCVAHASGGGGDQMRTRPSRVESVVELLRQMG